MRISSYQVLIALIVFLLCLTASASHAENTSDAIPQHEKQLFNEVVFHSDRGKELDKRKFISEERLLQKKIQLLKEIAIDAKLQRQSMEDFQIFVKWMTANLADYGKYLKAGSYAAVVARFLPIPYAGQASVFTKFAAQFTLSLNSASIAINSFMNSSQQFIAMTDTLDILTPYERARLAEVSSFADIQLLKDMNDTQMRLASVADLSSGALSFLESLDHYLSGTDEYWNKAKGMFRKDVDPKEKSFLTESTDNLKNKAAFFSGKLANFAELTRKQNTRVKSLSVYEELLTEASR